VNAPETTSLWELLREAGYDQLDEISARDVTRALGQRGLSASPSLFAVLADLGETPRGPLAFDAPGLVVVRERLVEIVVEVSPSRLPALAGAGAAAAVAAAIGAYRWLPYAVSAGVTGIASTFVVWTRDQPRGALYGAGVSAVLFLIAVVAFVAVRWLTAL